MHSFGKADNPIRLRALAPIRGTDRSIYVLVFQTRKAGLTPASRSILGSLIANGKQLRLQRRNRSSILRRSTNFMALVFERFRRLAVNQSRECSTHSRRPSFLRPSFNGKDSVFLKRESEFDSQRLFHIRAVVQLERTQFSES